MKRQIRSKSIKTLCGIKLSQALLQSQISLVIRLESIPRRMCSRLIKILFIRKKPGMTHQNYEVIFQDQTLVIAQKFTLFLCKRAHNIFLVHLIRARRSLFKVRWYHKSRSQRRPWSMHQESNKLVKVFTSLHTVQHLRSQPPASKSRRPESRPQIQIRILKSVFEPRSQSLGAAAVEITMLTMLLLLLSHVMRA